MIYVTAALLVLAVCVTLNSLALTRIKNILNEMNRESNKDAGSIKRRLTWSKKREKKDLAQEVGGAK